MVKRNYKWFKEDEDRYKVIWDVFNGVVSREGGNWHWFIWVWSTDPNSDSSSDMFKGEVNSREEGQREVEGVLDLIG